MSSGTGDEHLEDYPVPSATINDFERAVTGGGSLLAVLKGVPATVPPGTRFNYSTLDTQVLGWVLEAAVGMPIAEYAADRLWDRIGAEGDAYYFLTGERPRTALAAVSPFLPEADGQDCFEVVLELLLDALELRAARARE